MPTGERVLHRQPYAHPPIVEAVINIQVRYPAGRVESLLLAGETAFAPDFARKQQLQVLNFNISADQAGSVSGGAPAQNLLGSKFSNDANSRIFQLRQEGFAYSHLEPYTTWEDLRGDAEPLWRRFRDVCQPERVTRLAAKYVNRLKLGPGAIPLGEYLNFYPESPDSFGPIQAFVSQVQLPQPMVGTKALALVTVASEQNSDPRVTSLVLDIDVFEEVDLAPDDPQIWQKLERMRDAKNEIFEAALTTTMKEKFK